MYSTERRLWWQLTLDKIVPIPVHLVARRCDIGDVLPGTLELVKDARLILDEVIGKGCMIGQRKNR